MRKFLFLLFGIVAANAAQGADLKLKAPAASNWLVYPYTGSGCYWGVNSEAGVAQANVNGGGTFASSLVNGNLTAAGASVGASVGCIKGNGTHWIALQANGNWQNISASVPVAGVNDTIASRWQASQVVKIGGFSSLLAWLPNLGIEFPTLPPPPVAPGGVALINTSSHSYFMAGLQEFDVSSSFGLVAGKKIEAAPLVGMGVLNQIADATGRPSGAVLDVYAKVVFANRGFTFGNGAIGGSAKLGTEYFAGLAIYY